MTVLLGIILALQNINPQPAPSLPGYAQVRTMPVPVVAGDITDRPYRVIAEIKTNVRKWTIFEKNPSEQHVYNELWERARKLGADAVVNAKYSETLYGGLTWGRRHASGQAIKFLSDDEIARMKVASGQTSKASPQPPVETVTPAKPAAPSKKRSAVTCVTCN
ncbi:hypothetical protein LVY65_05020 [Sphingomonas sp. G124]|uniref:Uncharacterized protein n=1 Tax=Sphingomonas cremea TaxID=2904799 RepID=A0A9X1QLV8_9SPHN|nr:hypothetical protein [Sphingomonas cremea]MCF2514427.1 hypothetical protein [Sphingomonas cremea]